MTVDDNELMLRFKGGDAGAFEALYARHKGPLYRYFVRQAPRELADDLFQDVWARIVKGSRRYVPSAPFPAYLYRIAHNVLVDHYRRAGRALESVGTEVDPVDPGAGPVLAYERALLRDRLSEALGSLPGPQREAFLLHEEAGLTLEQIADVVGAGRETVKSRLRYAVGRLKAALRDEAEALQRQA